MSERRLGLVILAAGEGKRMNSTRHKALHEVAGQAMLDRVLAAAAPLNPVATVVVVGHLGDQVRRHCGPRIAFVDQFERRGTGHATLQTKDALAGRVDDVLVVYADTCLVRGETLGELVAGHHANAATLSLMTAILPDATGYGRIVRDVASEVIGIVEHTVATEAQRQIREMNAGPCCLDAAWLWPALEALEPAPSGEVYLTGLVERAVAEGRRIASVIGDPIEAHGVNDRAQLAEAERYARDRIRQRHLVNGVTMIDPASCWIDESVVIGRDTVLQPNVFLTDDCRIGANCLIGPFTQIRASVIGDGCRIWSSVIEECELAAGVVVGPMSRLRGGSRLETGVYVGNFAEIKNSQVDRDTKIPHFSYMGDATVGVNVNYAAGVITCNYDRETEAKERTIIGDDVGLGSDTLLVAPVNIGERSLTGSGSVVTKDIPPDSLAFGVPARVQRQRRASDGAD